MYSVITECNLSHSLPDVVNILELFILNLEEACDI